MGFHKWEDIPRRAHMRKGTWRRAISTEGLAVQRCEVEPGTHYDGRLHRHPEEQLVVVLEGRLRLRVGDEEGWLGPGEFGAVPGDVFHGGVGVGPEGAVYLEIFAPGRLDYLPGYVGPERNEFRGP